MSVNSQYSRRNFLKIFTSLGLAWAAFFATLTGSLAATIRFFFPNVLFEPLSSFKAGFPEEYSSCVSTKWVDKFGVWIVREKEGFFALSTVCTHLGCTPNWLEAENKFKCPCHGSGFHRDGRNFEGPAPRPLEKFKITLAEDGQILIDKSSKFLFEKEEWENPEAFLRI